MKSNTSNTSKHGVQGEGDYASAKKYNQNARAFVDSGKVEQAAKDSVPRNANEEVAMQKAEAEGRAHAKGQSNEGRGGNMPGGDKQTKHAPAKQPLGKPVAEKLPGR